MRNKPKGTGSVECAEERKSDMLEMMSRLLRKQTARDVDTDVLTSDRVNYHYLIVVFDDVVQKKTDDPQVRLTRLIKYTDGEPKKMVGQCIH